MRTGRYHSKGKFLLTGEYFVLYGAKALAVPLKFGQHMEIAEIPEKGLLKWYTLVKDQLWFSAEFQADSFEILQASDDRTARIVQHLLQEGRRLQPGLSLGRTGFSVRNDIDFDLDWGLGSSSSLVSNLAYWLGIDPWELYCTSYQGSGYDVHCARAGNPILYQLADEKPDMKEIAFNPPFMDNLFFVYLGRKQDSQESVRRFRAFQYEDDRIIGDISALTEAMIKAGKLEEFLTIMREHECLVSAALGLPRVKEELFREFPGEIKSLGAWGGDFVLAGCEMSEVEARQYFKKKNMPVLFTWNQIVYNEI